MKPRREQNAAASRRILDLIALDELEALRHRCPTCFAEPWKRCRGISRFNARGPHPSRPSGTQQTGES